MQKTLVQSYIYYICISYHFSLNADLDYIVSATDLLNALKATPSRMNAHPIITNINELQETVAYSMVTCSGIERHFKDRDVFEQIVDATLQLKHEVHC